ncbi:MAG: OmpA family protein [Deltaproteobacteria bacterium]|nr:OmpA family protein [Deltaproteobacteria bacterium]
MARENNKPAQSEFKVDVNAWMVTFGDLIMLLLTFFVMLLTMKSMDSGALKDRFKEFAETTGPMEFSDSTPGGSLIEGEYVYKRSVVISNNKTLEEVFDLLEGIERKKADEFNLEKLRQIIEIQEDHRGVVIIMEFAHLFDSGKAEISPERFAVLDVIGSLFQYVVNDIVIMGHSDNQPLKGGVFRSNFELSVYRALSVLFYLTQGLGLKPERFAAGGYGPLRPRFPNDSEQNRSKNRRIEFILRKPA